jgi:hypothetical protein
MRTTWSNAGFRGRLCVAAIIAAIFSIPAPTASLAADTAPIKTTVDQIIKSPKSFAGKLVRLEGQFDNCISLNCNLCPSDMSRDTFDRNKCLATAFDEFDGGGSYGAQQPMEPVFRFATVILDAWFDPGCMDGTAFCTDKAVVLSGARVLSVLSRKNALNGLIGDYDMGPLTIAGNDDAKQMKNEVAALPDFPTKMEAHFFVSTREPWPGSTATGLACFCLAQSCEGRWPTRVFGGFDTPSNPFRCWHLEKVVVGWRVMPGDF